MKCTLIIISLLLLSSSCRNRNYVISDYIAFTEEIKCIIKNATPVNKTTDIILNGRYYDPADPNFEKCIKH